MSLIEIRGKPDKKQIRTKRETTSIPPKKPKKSSTNSSPSKKTGHFEGYFWLWPDGKMTHMKFIQMAIQTKKQMPPGFFKQCEISKNRGIVEMGKIALKFGLKEMESFD